MCGISVILDFSGKAETNHLKNMMAATHHRGPDANNFLEKEVGGARLFMGANRLQIVDKEEASNQPLVSLNGRYALVFNGEIYNFEAIRNTLLNEGIQFSTRSDTEVLLFHLIKKGTEGLKDLNGMFAFVFADLENGELIVGRDSLGIKPLFAYRANNKIIISSEINGILASGLVEKKLNEEVIPHYLAYKYAPRPATFYKHIEEVMPGAIWEVGAKGKVEQSIISTARRLEGNATLKQLLVDSVVQQYSQVNNTGIMLSGGIDSTLLLAVLNKELGYNHVPVYTIGGSEKSFARQAAVQYNAEYNEIPLEIGVMDRLDEYIATIDQPIADSAALLTWLIAENATKHSKVLLSGAGADELFAGYNRHIALNFYLNNRNKLWFNGIKHMKLISNVLPKLNHLRKLADSIDNDPSTTFNNFLQSGVFRLRPQSLWEPEATNVMHLRRALEHDQTCYLGSDVLAITDHATMQKSIETRVPYLDAKLVSYSRNLPANDLFKNGSKRLLKDVLLGYGGEKFTNRKKQGFGLPLDSWLRNSTKKEWWDFNQKECQLHTFVTSQTIDVLIRKHQLGKADFSQDLWRVLVLQKWLERNF